MHRATTSANAILLLMATGVCSAQQYSFRHYGAAEGLQNLTVLSLAQDGEGYVWTGSESGLYRYDGTSFRLMGVAEGLPCLAEVQALHVATDGALWTNTCSKLFRFDGHRFHQAAGISEMLSRAQAIADGPDGRLVVATGAGLLELEPDGAQGSFTARPYPAGIGKSSKGVLRHGTQLWFGCETRLCMEEDQRVSQYGAAEGLPADSWDGIGVTPDGTVWARSPTRLYRKPPGAGRFARETASIASSMYWGALTIAPDGTVMVPTDQGVAINQGGRWNVIDESRGLRSSMASAVLRDRQGSLWVGLIGAGLARRLGSGEWESWTRQQGLASNLIWNILRDKKGALWVATNMGLTRLQGQRPTRTWTSKEGLGGENVRWLGETPDGAIWEITKPGWLARIDPSTGAVRPAGKQDGLADANPFRGLVDHAGRLWVAAGTGVFRNDAPGSSGRFVKVSPPELSAKGAWALSEDRRHTVWVTGPDGLWGWAAGQWRKYARADGLLNDHPYIAAVAPDNSLWLRHRFDAGVERVETDGARILRSTVIVPSDPGSADVTAFHGFDALGNFWRGTAAGVSVLHDQSWTRYSTENGLVWDDCDGEAFWADADGSVWIGTSGGLCHFRPLGPASSPPTADPIVSSLEIRDRPRLVRVFFSSLDYQYEQLVRFGYRLDDGAWTETPGRSISIAGLSPGRHRLEIRSQVRSGPFSMKHAMAEFSVAPFWWESWWFRSAALLFVVSLIYGAVLWRHMALRARNAALERAVLERTAELEAERVKVIAEKQRADAASEAKGQFLANMSHEIRTPLSGLLGLTGLLDGMGDPAELRETTRLIRSSGQMLLGTINDVLDFSKVEADKLELHIAPFELSRGLDEAVGLFRATAVEKNLYLGLTLAPDLPAWVAGDEVRLRQVVQNLVSNALKFTETGQIVLSASVHSRQEAAYMIRIEVRDTGIGIPPDRISHLFTEFSQADSSVSHRYGGTGLGLAISKRLVELMGGSIGVESQPGVGSTFRFRVRLAPAAAPLPVPVVQLDMKDVSMLRVLLAEDNKVNQLVGRKLLGKFGISADIAEDGSQAVAAAMRNAYDVILMDVQMPNVDGIAATRQIRTSLAADRQPFICGLTAHATTDIQELCQSAGMDAYLTKPLDFEKLRQLLVERSERCAVRTI